MQSIQDARDTLNTFISAHFTIMSLERIGVFLIYPCTHAPSLTLTRSTFAARYFYTHDQCHININDMESKQISYSLLKMSHPKFFAGIALRSSKDETQNTGW